MPNFSFIPNTTQIPNLAIDFLMANLPESEFKVLCYIYRRTFGFQKMGDYISLSQMANGLINKKGERLDYGTGLSRPTIIKAIKNLSRLSLIIIVKSRGTNYYKPVLDIDIDFILKKIPELSTSTTKKIKERFNQMKMFLKIF